MPSKAKIATHLLQTCSGACIASSAKGKPEASYVPFIWLHDRIYILISELAGHTKNLRSTPSCSLLLLHEQTLDAATDPFARTRMSLETSAEFIERDSDTWSQAMSDLITRHGETAKVLANLPDFHLVTLKIISGTVIEGFGKAFAFKGTDFDQARGLSGK